MNAHCSSEDVDQGIQLSHPCSPTRSPRSDSQIYQDDHPRSRHFSARLFQLTPVAVCVWHFKTNISKLQCVQNDLAWIVQAGIPAQNRCSNRSALASRLQSSRGENDIQDRSRHIQHANFWTYPQSAEQLHTFTEPEVRGTASPLPRKQTGTASTHQRERQPQSEHSRHVSR